MDASTRPEIEFFAHAPCGSDFRIVLRRRVAEALPGCLESPGAGDCVLPELERVEVSLVTDGAIAAVHGEFLNDPQPTDVITFPHGEILVSLETAERESVAHGWGPGEETFLYVVHGLLHLNGHRDAEDAERRVMTRRQERIVAEVLEREGM